MEGDIRVCLYKEMGDFDMASGSGDDWRRNYFQRRASYETPKTASNEALKRIILSGECSG
jgi:hypothetical protein